MAGNDTSLKDTLKSALTDTKETPKTDKTDTTDTKSQTVDTKSGETTVEISGIKIDLSDVPEQDRPRIKKLAEEKLSLGDKGIRQKLTELNESKKRVETLERAMGELVDLGYTPESALDVLKKSKLTTTEANKAARGFDKKIREIESMSGIDLAEKQQAIKNLQEARELLKEETGLDDLTKKIDSIEKSLGLLLGSHTESRKSQIDTQIDELSKEYGKDFVEKYRDVIVDEAIKFNVSPQKVLFFRAEPKEIEQSLLARGKKGNDKVNAISSPGSGITSASEKIDFKKPWKGFLKDLIDSNKK